MCGRFAIAPARADAWATMGDLLGANVETMLRALEPMFNVAPTTRIPIVIQHRSTGAIEAVLARWGFIPPWWNEVTPPKFSTFNARSEDAATKPLWRDAWLHRRCLIAATHWYEWRRDADGKRPFALQPAHGEAFMFAGLYSRWRPPGSDETITTAAILTREASPSAAAVHQRMPLILHPLAWNAWIDPLRTTRELVDDVLVVHTVMEVRTARLSTRINSTRNQDAGVLDPPEGDGDAR